MVRLFNGETGAMLGAIPDAQLEFLARELEEESATDQDYYIDLDTLEILERDGADPSLVALLRNAIGSQQGIEVRWEKE
jgi:processive 1,2-diacylglycerol beta-glucosyltransferase